MFFLLSYAIRLLFLVFAVSVVLHFLGYDINWHYVEDQKTACHTRLAQCQKDLIRTGVEGAQATCDWKCAVLDTHLLIQKREEPEDTPSANEIPAETREDATIQTTPL